MFDKIIERHSIKILLGLINYEDLMSEIDSLLKDRFGISNLYWNSLTDFSKYDKHLRDLQGLRYVHSFSWWLSVVEPGVYLLYGGRQVGKTTSVKQYIRDKIGNTLVKPDDVFYLSCDAVVDRSELYDVMRRFLLTRLGREQRSILVVDEATYVRQWHLAVKAVIDEGLTNNVVCIITGSDRILLEEGAQGFPGIHRRGENGLDITINPLRFSEYVGLISP